MRVVYGRGGRRCVSAKGAVCEYTRDGVCYVQVKFARVFFCVFVCLGTSARVMDGRFILFVDEAVSVCVTNGLRARKRRCTCV